MKQSVKKAEITLEYQNYIERPPLPPEQLFGRAASNDAITISSWRKQWVDQFIENQKRFGPFSDRSIGTLFQKHKNQPIIVAGSGPSLKRNVTDLANRRDVALISCLHNFAFFEDHGVAPDYYVTLDAGEVTVEEVSEGGGKTPDEYWAITENRVLLAYVGSNPKLLEKWRGKIYFFNAPVADATYMEETAKVEDFGVYISNGGNVLGACTYIAKAILGALVTAFVGADFSFDYDHCFHPHQSKYDKNLGQIIKLTDVFGNQRKTWQSYYNFKCWFEWLVIQVPGIYINCTEGGCFGSYQDGNIMQLPQWDLRFFIETLNMSEEVRQQCEDPKCGVRKLLF